MARQQRWMVPDAAEARARESLVGDARVRVGRDDQIGALDNRLGRHVHRILEHDDVEPRRLRGFGQSVILRGNDDACDIETLREQSLEGRSAEIA